MTYVNLHRTSIDLYEGKRVAPRDHPAGEPMDHGWEAGVWEENLEPGKVRWIFGLTYRGRPTHMAYELACDDYPDRHFDPCQVIVRLDEPGHGRFYFDAGGNGRPIWAERDALAESFVRLGLVLTDWPEPVGADNQADPHKENTHA